MFYSIVRFLLAPFFRIFYPFKTIHKQRLTNEGNTIIICNHLGKIDVVYVELLFKGKSYIISKKEWFKNKLQSKILYSLGAIPVDRDKPDLKAMKMGLEVLKNNKRFIMFPEGTRNKTEADLLPIKNGPGYFAHKCNSTIIPLTIYKKGKFMRKNYVYVGEPFKLDCQEQKFTAEVNDKITQRITDELLKLRKEVNEYVAEKKKK